MNAGMNWAGNHAYAAREVLTPATEAELGDILTATDHLHILGTRHSFNDVADIPGGVLVSLAGLPATVDIDAASHSVTVAAGVRYGDLARKLQAAGFALANLASLPHISVAGTISTATHGSGDGIGNLATAVNKLVMLTPEGRRVELRRGDADFAGAVVGIGALGAIIEVGLDLEPSFNVRQRVFTDLAWGTVMERYEEITGSAYSVSLFTRWDSDSVAQVWVKERAERESAIGDDFFGARAAVGPMHMIEGMDVANVTEQGGVVGPWHERLTHFRLDFTPSAGAEIQSEYLLPRERAREAFAAVRKLGPQLAPLLQIAEIRTVAADDLWLSTAQGRDTVALHFTWLRKNEQVAAVVAQLEEALLPLDARPHWGKVFLDKDHVVPSRYEHMAEFRELAERYDPQHKMRNPFLDRLLG